MTKISDITFWSNDLKENKGPFYVFFYELKSNLDYVQGFYYFLDSDRLCFVNTKKKGDDILEDIAGKDKETILKAVKLQIRKQRICKLKSYKVRTICINNKYDDFGSHTGFQTVKRKIDCYVGEEVEFKTKFYTGSNNVAYLLIRDGKASDCTGSIFHINENDGEYHPSIYDFEYFFMHPDKYQKYKRENKLKRILK